MNNIVTAIIVLFYAIVALCSIFIIIDSETPVKPPHIGRQW